LDLERKILAAAFKHCFEAGDSDGAAFAHKGLCSIIQQQLFSGDGSSGSVIPASVWQQAAPETPELQPIAEEPVAIEPPVSEADPTAPLNYLDFGEEAAEEAPAPPEVPTVAAPEAPPMSPSQAIRMKTMYQILGVSQVASFEEIHARYLRLMRRLLQSRYSAENTITDFREFREVLRAICVAHDILKDPVTRTDYDLRQVGLRTEVPAGDEGKPLLQRRRLMLGELLECAEILQSAELQVALDMHKAEPGMQFGEFLVTANFLSQEELDCTLMAQRLISSGKITVNQFRTAMYAMRDEGTAFFDTLMIEGWLSAADIFDPSSSLWDTGENNNGSAPAEEPAPAETAAPPRAIPPEWNDVPEELLQTEDEDPQPEPAKVVNWSERDALAETQSIDLSAFRSALARKEAGED
jgi:curved DNA-binding protein CbpA